MKKTKLPDQKVQMVTLPTIPVTPSNPLTVETALYSLMGIGLIFKDQKQFYKRYEPIIVSCPFSMLDFAGFKTDVYKFMAIDKQEILKRLKAINELAAGNMRFYETYIENREFESPEPWEKYYIFRSDELTGTGFFSVNGLPMAEEIVKRNEQTKRYPTLFWFYDFCKEVKKFTSDFLVEPDKLNQAATPVET